MSFFSKLSEDTLTNLAESNFKAPSKKRSAIVRQFAKDIDESGVKGLAFSMKNLELTEVCNFLKVEHQGNNPKNRMVLTKRFMESISETGLEKWFDSCDDLKVIQILCDALAIEFSDDDSCEELKERAISEIRTHGANMVLSRMTLAQLKQCCADMELENYELSNSKIALITAIIHQTPVEVKDAPRKVAVKKVPISKATEFEQLNQHYLLSDMVEFCRRQKLRVSGTKKEVIHRIISHNLGDKENSEAPKNSAKPQAKRGKKSTKKPASKKPVERKSEDDNASAEDSEAADSNSAEELESNSAEEPESNSAEEPESNSAEEPESNSAEEPEANSEDEPQAEAKSDDDADLAASEESEDPVSEESEEPAPKPTKQANKTSAKETAKKPAPIKQAAPRKRVIEDSASDEESEGASEPEPVQETKPVPKKAKLPERSSVTPAEDPLAPTDLTGKYVCVSARGFERSTKEIYELIEAAGGTPETTLSKKTHFLLVADRVKFAKAVAAATKLKIPVVGEEFLKNLAK
jgi:hypothetical protein